MIPARRSARFARWFARHAETRITRTFGRVYARGLEGLTAALAEGPVLLVSNHTSWWDPLVAVFVAHRVLGADPFAMMDADNLRRFPFFTRVGAFGVERGELRDEAEGAAAIEYAVGLLSRPGRLVWIFPQGDERPDDARPLGFRRGAAAVAVAAHATVVPLAIRYVFQHRERPFLWLDFGPPAKAEHTVDAERARQEAAVEMGLGRVSAALRDRGPHEFSVLRQARASWLGRLAQWALAWFTRRHVRASARPESGARPRDARPPGPSGRPR